MQVQQPTYEPGLHDDQKNILAKLSQVKCDPNLGFEVHKNLCAMGVETPFTQDIINSYEPHQAVQALEDGVKKAMFSLGLDTNNPSLKDTPARFACMVVGELTKGLCYDLFPKCTTTPAETNDLVLVRNNTVLSLCEHHLQTIDGYAHIAYIPNEHWLGLSKFSRVVEFFSRRPQVQERLTAQIYHALSYILDTPDVAVVITAKHYCMKARGVLSANSDTITDKMGGRFFTNPSLRAELMDAVR